MSEEPEASKQRLWPAYLVAAVCFAVAVALSILNLSLVEQVHTLQAEMGDEQHRATGLTQQLLAERSTVTDLMDEHAERTDVPGGQIVRVRNRIYLTLHDLPTPPRGKIYQAWTMPKGGRDLLPSLTFLPDAHGLAIVALSAPADATERVAVSVEPEGGSKTPTNPLVLSAAF